MSRRFVAALCCSMLAIAGVSAQTPPPPDTDPLSDGDRLNFRTALQLARHLGDRLWPGWAGAPAGTVLVLRHHDVLLCAPGPVDGYRPAASEPAVGCSVQARRRREVPVPPDPFTVVGTSPTVVLGRALYPERVWPLWTTTWLHEHFHQFQMADPGYLPALDRLDLANGDRTGRWMLAYPFPYDDVRVVGAYQSLARALLALFRAVDGDGDGGAPRAADAYRAAKQAFREALPAADYRYAAFQAWQEGVARYTEYRIGRMVASASDLPPDLRGHVDAGRFDRDADQLLRTTLGDLERADLATQRRLAFYAIGMVEALVLDALRPDWRAQYRQYRFDLDRLLAAPG